MSERAETGEVPFDVRFAVPWEIFDLLVVVGLASRAVGLQAGPLPHPPESYLPTLERVRQKLVNAGLL